MSNAPRIGTLRFWALRDVMTECGMTYQLLSARAQPRLRFFRHAIIQSQRRAVQRSTCYTWPSAPIAKTFWPHKKNSNGVALSSNFRTTKFLIRFTFAIRTATNWRSRLTNWMSNNATQLDGLSQLIF